MAIKRLYVPEDKRGPHGRGPGGPGGDRGGGRRPGRRGDHGSRPPARGPRPGGADAGPGRSGRGPGPPSRPDPRRGRRFAGGYLVSPAIVEGAGDDDSIVCDEQFAPALPVLGYRTLDEAVDRANASPFGLCASIWTGDDAVADDGGRPVPGGHRVRQRPRHLGHGPPGSFRGLEAVGLRCRARTRGHAGLHPAPDHPASLLRKARATRPRARRTPPLFTHF
jgi:hypothetical protein